MSRYNACQMCKHGIKCKTSPAFWCLKKLTFIPMFKDTSECKEFEKQEEGRGSDG